MDKPFFNFDPNKHCHISWFEKLCLWFVKEKTMTDIYEHGDETVETKLTAKFLNGQIYILKENTVRKLKPTQNVEASTNPVLDMWLKGLHISGE